MQHCFVFFFQAEDGIRDLVRSRGLGDVYKRQLAGGGDGTLASGNGGLDLRLEVLGRAGGADALHAVSYTHLTLPTSDLV